MMIGQERQQDFLSSLGLFSPTPVEMIEARGARPLLPKNWSEIHTMTVSYGHGISASPLHLASAYATMLGNGTRVNPTILKTNEPVAGEQVISASSAGQAT